MFLTRTIGPFIALFSIVLSCSALAAEEIQAGAARVDLTPPVSMKAALGGYGERMSRPAEGVHDRVFAKALVLSAGEKRYAVVTADILGFPPPVKTAVVEALSDEGWTAAQILLLPSHSHTSIEMMQINPNNQLGIPQIGLFSQAVYEHTVNKLVQVIQKAASQSEPVSIGTARKNLPGYNANRRRRGGPTDTQLTVTRIDRRGGGPLAVLVNWTAHPTFMSAEDMQFSGGWPGHMQRTLEAALGGDVTAMYYNGAEGDQRPTARPDSGPSHWERAERYGRELGLVTAAVAESVETAADVPFSYHLHQFDLPQRAAHPQFMETGGTEYGLTEESVQTVLGMLVPAETTTGALRLGDLLIVGVPGEMAAELGAEIKTEATRVLGVRFATIGGLANQWVSYILPSAEYERGGYEASVSFYGATLGDTIVEQTLVGVREMAAAGDGSR